jgi:hypothetical protein
MVKASAVPTGRRHAGASAIRVETTAQQPRRRRDPGAAEVASVANESKS